MFMCVQNEGRGGPAEEEEDAGEGGLAPGHVCVGDCQVEQDSRRRRRHAGVAVFFSGCCSFTLAPPPSARAAAAPAAY